ncbi:MAG: nucleotide pyrophosphatase/phosphodiesterase family protein [Candidatus Nanopelagicales bacterium]
MTPLAALIPSVLAIFGLPGERDDLGLADRLDGVRRCAIVLIDGLGYRQLRERPELAPFLTSLLTELDVLTAGFPSTTASSLGSLGTGLMPGAHGLLGYQVLDPARDVVVNELKWDPELDPRVWQPRRTVFERAVAAGLAVTRVGPGEFDGSGLTDAALRGGRYVAADGLRQTMAATMDALSEASLVYAYWSAVDINGHLFGVASTQWRKHVARVDSALAAVAARLPAETAVLVTADHGMVNVLDKVDVDEVAELRMGVRHLAGEPRARYIVVEPGAVDDVTATWTAVLGDDFRVVLTEEAVAAGWFGPTPTAHAARIGDIVVVPTGLGAVVASLAEPLESSLVGYHGAMSAAELEVPLVVIRARGG